MHGLPSFFFVCVCVCAGEGGAVEQAVLGTASLCACLWPGVWNHPIDGLDWLCIVSGVGSCCWLVSFCPSPMTSYQQLTSACACAFPDPCSSSQPASSLLQCWPLTNSCKLRTRASWPCCALTKTIHSQRASSLQCLASWYVVCASVRVHSPTHQAQPLSLTPTTARLSH